MIHNKNDIVILESSHIIFEGLSNLLFRSSNFNRIIKVVDLNELKNIQKKERQYIFIINPLYLQNTLKEFQLIKKNFKCARWIALIHQIFPKEIISSFDEVININDSIDEIINKIIKNVSQADNTRYSANTLSEREIEVLKLIASGLSNKEIAQKLFISIHTVISHRKNITQKTNIKSQSGLTIYALSNKIIKIEDFGY